MFFNRIFSSAPQKDLLRLKIMQKIAIISEKEFYISSVRSLLAAIQNKDTSTQIFHGCFDWHSAVHGHWAILRIFNYRKNLPALSSLSKDEENLLASASEQVARRLSDVKGIQSELKLLNTDLDFEFPYGRAWFLRLAIEFKDYSSNLSVEQSNQYKALYSAANEVALHMLKVYNANYIDIMAPEYDNPSWALVQLFDFFKSGDQHEFAAQVAILVKKNYLIDVQTPEHNYVVDKTKPHFFSAFGNMVYAVLKTQSNEDIQTFLIKNKDALNSEELAPIKMNEKSLIHHFGTNWSRIWSFNAIKKAINLMEGKLFEDTDDIVKLLDQAIDKHVEEGLKMHQFLSTHKTHAGMSAYLVYDHWVPQFGVYALTDL